MARRIIYKDTAGREYSRDFYRSFAKHVSARRQGQPFIVTIKQSQFMDEINKWPGLMEAQIEQILDEITQLALENIKNRTPVLTGEAKSQWFWMHPSRWERFIGNNWPGIRRLEHGWSRQPNKWFMVRSTEKRMPIWAKRLAAKYWRGNLARKEALAAR